MRNQHGYVGNLGGNAENAENQCGDTGNQGRNLGITVEMTLNSSGNYKLKEWREVKIIENKHICKNLVSQFDLVPFLLTLEIFPTMSFCFIIDFEQINTC